MLNDPLKASGKEGLRCDGTKVEQGWEDDRR